MTIEDFKIQIIDNGDCYTAYLDHKDFTGVAVQTDSLESIPEELSLSFRAMLQYGMDIGNYNLTTWSNDTENK